MGKIVGADVLLKCLIQEKVKYIFGVPGGQILPVLDAVHRMREEAGIDFIMTRHEQAAAHMADAWSRLTGEVGVCLSTLGPGAVDLVPGVFEAFAEGSPILVMTAQNQSWRSYPDHGSTHPSNNYELFKPITKWNAVVSHWERIPELVQRAFRTALAGKPGPVHLDFPVDVLFKKDDEEKVKILSPERYRAQVASSGDMSAIKKAVEMIKDAKIVLLHSGGGVLRAGAWGELKELAEYLNSPVTTSIFGRSAISEEHPLCLIPAGYGALTAQAEADLVILIGGKLGDLDLWGKPPAWGVPEKQKLIQIDISEESIGLNREVDLAIIGDAKAVLEQILSELKGSNFVKREESKDDVKRYRKIQDEWLSPLLKQAQSDEIPIHPLRLIKEVREFFPKDAITVVDGGNTQVWCNYLNRVYEPRTILHQADSGMLGGGLPKAIAAKLAYPRKEVYTITGDGALMLNIQELETARRLNLPLVVIVANDRSWGMIKSGQKDAYEGRYIGVDFFDVRYDKVAEAMGCYGERVESPQDIESALKRALSSKLPAVIDIMINPEINLNPPDLGLIFNIWLEGV